MHMGAELAPAMITALATLYDGSLVSGLKNGKMQLWRHCRRVWEEPQVQGAQGPVSAICAATHPSEVAFAAAGNAAVTLWDLDGNCLHAVGSPQLCTPVELSFAPPQPSGILPLAVRFAQAQAFDDGAFRLVALDEA